MLGITSKLLDGTLRFASPIVAMLIFLFLIIIIDIETTAKDLLFLPAYMFPPFGKESIIPIAIARGVNPLIVSSSIIALDSLTAVFLALNFNLLYSLPFFGNLIKKFEKVGNKTLERRKWIKRFSTLGLLLFMLIPFQGTGAVSTSLIGRLAGVDVYRVVLAVVAGSVVTTVTLTFFSGLVRSLFTG